MTGGPLVSLIGYGEVGQILATDLAEAVSGLTAWDILFADEAGATSLAASAIRRGKNAEDAVKDADIVICAVTAAQTLEAARAAAPALKKGAFFLDLNSASPGTKQSAAAAVSESGARYVEGAVMSPAPPKRLATPILLGGSHAEGFMEYALMLGFSDTKVFSTEIGKASAAKMCRSVMVKGVEALLTESLLTGRRYGVEDTVTASLSDLFPGPDWPRLAHYMISRSIEHGQRRAEEMREAAKTVQEAGLTPLMSIACAERQERTADFADALNACGLHNMLDAMLRGADQHKGTS